MPFSFDKDCSWLDKRTYADARILKNWKERAMCRLPKKSPKECNTISCWTAGVRPICHIHLRTYFWVSFCDHDISPFLPRLSKYSLLQLKTVLAGGWPDVYLCRFLGDLHDWWIVWATYMYFCCEPLCKKRKFNHDKVRYRKTTMYPDQKTS